MTELVPPKELVPSVLGLGVGSGRERRVVAAGPEVQDVGVVGEEQAVQDLALLVYLLLYYQTPTATQQKKAYPTILP